MKSLGDWKLTDGIGSDKKEATSSLDIRPKKGRVTVPHPKRDRTIRTIKSIEKQSGLRLL